MLLTLTMPEVNCVPLSFGVRPIFPRTLPLGIYAQVQATVQKTDPPDKVISCPKETMLLPWQMIPRI